LVIASGSANEIKIPSIGRDIPSHIQQIHTSQYRNPAQLRAGAVLVVGGAQSGCQIAEDLADAGRRVFLSTSMVARLPRRYRGRDIVDWLIDMKFFDMRAEQIEDPKMLNLKPPQITGIGTGERTLSLQSLAKKGIVILGRTDHADQENIFFLPNAADHVHFADGFSKLAKEMVDGFINKNQLIAALPEIDEDDVPDANVTCVSGITSLNFAGNNIQAIIWATGFNVDHSYIKLPVFDNSGHLEHKDGIPRFPGIYFIGYPWLRVRGSTIIFGIREDAKFIAEKIFNRSMEGLKSNRRTNTVNV
jgi:putative flavoprotein involved in K+ transport